LDADSAIVAELWSTRQERDACRLDLENLKEERLMLQDRSSVLEADVEAAVEQLRSMEAAL